MENAYLKKLNALVQSKNILQSKIKAQVIFELRLDYPITALLQLAQIPRSTYYYWISAAERQDKDADVKGHIKAIYHDHKGRYGYRRITDELRNQGHLVNHKKVQRIMRELGLNCIVRMKKYRSYKGAVGKIAPNILETGFHRHQDLTRNG